MNKDLQQYIDNTASSSLYRFRRIQHPSAISFKIAPATSPLEETDSLLTDHVVVFSRSAADIASKLRSLGINQISELPAPHEGNTRFVFFSSKHTPSHKFVAPWYVDVYRNKALLNQNVKQLLGILSQASRLNPEHFIFRGEQSMFPNVRSSLSRRWNTNSPETLKALSNDALNVCLPFLTIQHSSQIDISSAQERGHFDILAHIQHKGGDTNLIDFTSEIWVALYFACINPTALSPTVRKFGNIGRIWKLNRTKQYDDLEIHNLNFELGQTPNNRWESQAGVAVIPNSGVISACYLEEVARIDGSLKKELNQFLRLIGISTSTMFNDIDGYIQFGQEQVSLQTMRHLVIGWLSAEEYDRVLDASEFLLAQEDPFDVANGYHFRSLYHIVKGNLEQAWSDNEQAGKSGITNLVEVTQKNRRVIRLHALAKAAGQWEEVTESFKDPLDWFVFDE